MQLSSEENSVKQTALLRRVFGIRSLEIGIRIVADVRAIRKVAPTKGEGRMKESSKCGSIRHVRAV